MAEPARPARRSTFSRLLQDPRAVGAGAVLVCLVLIAIFAPLLAPHDPEAIDPAASLARPSADHWLGADQLGRDVLSRLMFGARLSLQISIESVTLAVLVGVTLGVLSSYFGGWIELIVMRVVDVLLVFPALVLAITVAAYLGPSVEHIALVIGIVYMPIFARLAYSVTAVTRRAEFVQAARALGASHARIILRGILPNSLAPLIVQVSLSLGFAVLAESGLSFLGVGVPPPATSWGAEIAGARLTLDKDPLLVVWPSAVLGLAILSFNVLGDALRDVLDPRIRENR
ncbi:MAG: ABC transporter permease [Chloroflexi bacterium]|nr:ABC transporter permease [Chloroflexota bacterium]